MAAHIFTPFKEKVMEGSFNLTSDDIRLILVDNTTTADTEEDTEFVSGLTTLGEIAATNYSRGALTGEAVTADNTDNEGVFDAADFTFSSIGGASDATVVAGVLYKHVTNDTDSPLIAYIDDIAFTTNGGDVTIQWNAEGILNLT